MDADPFAIFNLLEAALWWIVGAVAALHARAHSSHKKAILLTAAGVLFVFGWSDWVEAKLGAPFPWWLWVWKVGCGAALLALRLGWLGEWRFWRRPEFWFGLVLLAAAVAAMMLGG